MKKHTYISTSTLSRILNYFGITFQSPKHVINILKK